jgi:hypothetical protein
MNKKEYLIEYYLKKLEECEKDGVEEGHGYADTLLCELLKKLGYGEVAEKFESLKKWYA